MGYARKKFYLHENIKAFKFLMENFNCSMREAQKWIDRKRVFYNGKILSAKNVNLKGEVEVIYFQPSPVGLKPIFENDDFAVFDKPSGVLVHPNKLSDDYSLNDEIKSLFGKDANAVHRIDKETSGLVLVAKGKKSEVDLKILFENREVSKEYKALVRGKIEKSFTVNANLKSDISTSKIRIKSHIVNDGQTAITSISPLSYIKELDCSVIIAMPLTGRTHQIRAHLFHVKHPIVGDPIYGLNEDEADKFLNSNMSKEERKILTGSSRLMLHADFLSFVYGGMEYNIKSKIDFERLMYEYCKIR